MNSNDASMVAWTVLDNAKTRFEPMVGGASEKIAKSPARGPAVRIRPPARLMQRHASDADRFVVPHVRGSGAHQRGHLRFGHAGSQRNLSR